MLTCVYFAYFQSAAATTKLEEELAAATAKLEEEHAVAQRRAEEAEKMAEDAAAERDAFSAFLDAGKIPFALFIILLLCVVIIRQRSKTLELIELNEDSDFRVRRLTECLKIAQARGDLMMSLRRFQGN